jgi:hypothetical protein
MKSKIHAFVVFLALVVPVVFSGAPAAQSAADTLPASIPDKEFWALSEQLSEPNGTFQSDNLLSNEMTLSTVAAALALRAKPGGVYLGVGPEQNFTYIATIRPKIAFITDVRRGNMLLHLMYKALFELSADRAEFVSRLFTKPRQAGIGAASTAEQLINAYWDVPTSDKPVYDANLAAILDVLGKKHGFPLSPDDVAGITYVYNAFWWYGPAINYSSSATGRWGGTTTYGDLMITRDGPFGPERSYLSTEDGYAFLKQMHAKNLIVPVVGNFAGPKALRAVGGYLRDRGAVVTAFYLSNVEGYLRGTLWSDFCENVATMPLDANSVFIRPSIGGRIGVQTPTFVSFPATSGVGGRVTSVTTVTRTPTVPTPAGAPPRRAAPFGPMAEEVKSCR